MFFQSLGWRSASLPSAWESFSLSTSEMQRQMTRDVLVSMGLRPHVIETTSYVTTEANTSCKCLFMVLSLAAN